MHLRCTKFCPTTETNNCKKEFLNNRGKANVEGAQEFLDESEDNVFALSDKSILYSLGLRRFEKYPAFACYLDISQFFLSFIRIT